MKTLLHLGYPEDSESESLDRLLWDIDPVIFVDEDISDRIEGFEITSVTIIEFLIEHRVFRSFSDLCETERKIPLIIHFEKFRKESVEIVKSGIEGEDMTFRHSYFFFFMSASPVLQPIYELI